MIMQRIRRTLNIIFIIVIICGILASCDNGFADEVNFNSDIALDKNERNSENNITKENSAENHPAVKPEVTVDEVSERDSNWDSDLTQLENQLNAYIKRFLDVETSDKDKEISDKFSKELQLLRKEIPELDDFEIKVRMQMLIALFHDGHMQTEMLSIDKYSTTLPFTFEAFYDGFYCVSIYDNTYKDALNCRINAINDIPIEKIFEDFIFFFSGDNVYNSKAMLGRRLQFPTILKALNIIENLNEPITLTFTDISGNTFHINVENQLSLENLPKKISNRVDGPEAFFESREEDIWLQYLDESKILYVRMYYIPFPNELKDLNEQVSAYLANSNVSKIVIDLRGNGGGEMSLGKPWHQTLTSFGKQTGQLYVITDYDTFSMAATTAMYLKEEGNATIVGLSPAGGKPYIGGARNFNLRNSGFEIQMPISNFYSDGLLDFYPSIDNYILVPDIEIGISIEDYISKTDSVFELIQSL